MEKKPSKLDELEKIYCKEDPINVVPNTGEVGKRPRWYHDPVTDKQRKYLQIALKKYEITLTAFDVAVTCKGEATLAIAEIEKRRKTP